MKMKRIIATILSTALIVAGMAVVLAKAATQSAAEIPVKFTNANWEQEYWQTSHTDFWYGDDTISAFSKNLVFDYTLYIPKFVMEKDGSAVISDGSVNFSNNDEDRSYVGWAGGSIGIQILNTNGKYAVTYWDAVNEKDVNASKYATVKTSGDYIVLTVKNISIANTLMDVNGNSSEIDDTKSGYIDVNFGLSGVKTSAKGNVYLTDYKLYDGKTLLKKSDFSSKEGYFCGYNVNQSKEGEAKIVDFSNYLLKLSKTSATIKAGAKTTIKATATPSATITYKSSNTKIAKITSKGVVTGVKKGTAVITVKANGVSKKFTVKVK